MKDLQTNAEHEAAGKKKTLYFGAIDGQDLARLFAAYPAK
jgi:hypothetical protein